MVNWLLPRVGRIYICFSDAGKKVVDCELPSVSNPEVLSLRDIARGEIADHAREVIRVFGANDLFAPIASGSSAPTDMIILPCSMGTLARIANGNSGNLIERAADVVLKQKRRLIVCPRETPLSLIHLRNMVLLAEAGAAIVPPMPAFYGQPKSVADLVDFVTGRIVEMLDIPHELYHKWNARMV